MGLGLSPLHPSLMERVGLAVGGVVVRLFGLYLFTSIARRGDLLINNGREVGYASTVFRNILTGCPRSNSALLVTVPPGLDEAQIVAPGTFFVGPMRDMERYEPLPEGSAVWMFLERAASDGIPVVFMANGASQPISNQFLEERIAVIEELTRKGSVRVVWSNRRQGVHGFDTRSVLAAAWVPQEAVLRHKAVKVFVTHGGSTSMMEGIAAGVPFLCIPYAFEQVNNCIFLEERGLGIYVKKKASPDDLTKGIQAVLEKQELFAAHVSVVWDRIVSFGAGDDAYGARRAVHIIENVAKTGTDWMQPEICRWPIYQQFHLDVIGIFVVAAGCALWTCCSLCGLLRKLGRGKSKQD